MSVFDGAGMYFRNPRGGVEDTIAQIGDDGYTYVILNCQDFDPRSGVWDKIESQARAAGLPVVPFCRIYVIAENQGLSNADAVHWATKLAVDRYSGRVLYDLESAELDAPDVGETLDAIEADVKQYHLDASLSTEPRVKDVLRDTWVIQNLIMECQLYPQSSSTSQDPRWCRALFYEYGAKRVRFLIGTKDNNIYIDPSWLPPLQKPFTTWSADDVPYVPAPARYDEWAADDFGPIDVPYTGPLYGPSHRKGPSKPSGSIKALKIALYEAGYFGSANNPFKPDYAFNRALEEGLRRLQRDRGIDPTGQYGKGSYEALRRLQGVTPVKYGGEGYALTQEARTLLIADAHA